MSGDALWSYVQCLMHFDGPNNGLRIYDERHKAVTVTGNAKLSTLQSKFGGSSLALDGNGDRISIAGFTAPGTNDLTVECFVYPRATANATPVVWGNGTTVTSTTSLLFADHSTHPGKYALFVGSFSTTTALLVSTSDIVYGQFAHVAVTRSNQTFTLWINGVPEATATHAGTFGTGTTVYIGGVSATTAFDFFGYIDEFRYTHGASRYSGTSFTPPTAPFPNYGTSGVPTDQHYDKVVLHCHFDGEPGSTTFVDQKGHTLTPEASGVLPQISTATGAGKFGGSGLDCIGSAFYKRVKTESTDYSLGTGDFTLEFFYAYSGTSPTAYTFFALKASNGVDNAIQLSNNANSSVITVSINGTSAIVSATNAISTAQKHFALSRSGSSLRLFIDGTQSGSTYSIGSSAIDSNGTMYIGGLPTQAFSPCFFDEIRLTKGLARYTANFTPPSEPFPDYALQKLTGTVLDHNGNPLARTVRSFRRSDGLLIDTSTSDPTTGAFELRATDTTEHFVVVYDDAKNALIYDHITPVV